jgi:tetratricopeptide (TPR) repeat protein
VLVVYAYRTIFPLFLAPIYPIEFTVYRLQNLVSWLVLIGFVIPAVMKRKRYPALLTGLLLYLILLLPQGGLVRSGATVLADRYVHLANLPLLFGIAWIVSRALKSGFPRLPAVLALGAWIAFLIWKTVTYTGLWDDSEALTRVAYDRYPRAPIIELFMLRVYNNAAQTAAEKGKYQEAIRQVQRALRIEPDYADAYLTWTYVLERQGRPREAALVYRKALKIKRELGSAHINRGVRYGNRGDLAKAEEEFRKAIATGGDCAEARYNLGLIHKRREEWTAAAREFRRALAYRPGAPEVRRQLEEIAALSSRNRADVG